MSQKPGITANVDSATVLVLNPGYNNQGVDNDPTPEQVPPVEEEEEDFDDESTTQEIPLPPDIEKNLAGEQDGVQPQLDDTQGENTQIPTFTIDDQGSRVSTRE